jgi:LAO/AO transport system ATPase
MTQEPLRVLLAKVGLDGHDRGVKVLARAFRDAGMEVIYTGLWLTPAAAVKAAIEEDVDLFGVSFHSAAHMTLVPIIRKKLEEADRGDIPLALGGIIPPDDVPAMKAAGVSAVFDPETPLATIIDTCRDLARKMAGVRRQALAGGAFEEWNRRAAAGDRAALGRVLSAIEIGGSVSPGGKGGSKTTHPTRIGVTGAPGVGKSTLIGQLLREMRRRVERVGVIAVDPASPVTGGALLGDRARMTAGADDAGVFIRSVASRGALGGLSAATAPMTEALAAAGYDTLIVETVGAGQTDVVIRDIASPVVLVLMPGAGDDLQLSKAGITEIADVFVINKADLPGADRLESQIRETFGGPTSHRVYPGGMPPIVKTVASHGRGIAELADVLLNP